MVRKSAESADGQNAEGGGAAEKGRTSRRGGSRLREAPRWNIAAESVQRNSWRFEREKPVQQVNKPRGFRQTEKIGTKKFHRLRIGDPKIWQGINLREIDG